MKHLLKKFEIDGLFAVLTLAFACVSMWGAQMSGMKVKRMSLEHS